MVFFLRRVINKNLLVAEKNNKQNTCWGLTLQQWALLDSMLIFIITAVITMCSILGYIHSKEVIAILNDDIREEMADMDGYYDHRRGNHAVLYLSVDKVLVTNKIMAICMWASLVKLFCAALLVYGVSMKSAKCVIPWLAVSAASYIISFVLQIAGHYNAIPNVYITQKILVLTAIYGVLFAITWYGIFKYCRVLLLATPTPPLTVYKTKEGYQHTVSSYPQRMRKV